MKYSAKKILDIPKNWFERDVDFVLKGVGRFLNRKHNMEDALIFVSWCLLTVVMVIRLSN
jgi:hypothetical protein